LISEGAKRAAIHVVAGAVFGRDGRVLIAQRLPGKHLAGAWEFPGGKLEPGETRAAGLARELREELGIDIHQPRPLIRIRHAYAVGEVLIDAWVVTRYDGEPQGLDGQALRWCGHEELASAGLLPADRPIVRALQLPPRLTQASTASFHVGEAGPASRSPEGSARPRRGLLRGVWCSMAGEAAAAAREGADFVVMRHVMEGSEVERLCGEICIPVYIRAPTPECAFALGASGVSDIAP